MKARITILTVFLLVAALVAGLATLQRTEAKSRVEARAIKPAVVRTETLACENYQVVESFYGLIEPKSRVNLAFQIRGRLSQLGESREAILRENVQVKPGQVLALLEPDRYKAAVEQSEAQMEEAKAAMSTARASIDEAQARLDDAKMDQERIERLRQSNAVGERDVEKAQVTTRLAQAHYDAALAKLAGASASYDAARSASTMANVNLQDATLRSPIAGIVAAVPAEVGQMVDPGQLVVSVVDLTSVKLVVGVVERRLPLLREGQTVDVAIEALGTGAGMMHAGDATSKIRKGTVTMVPPAANAVTGLFNIEIALDNTDGRLRPGMIGKANVLVAEKPAISVPAEAVVRKSGEKVTTFFVTEGMHVGLSLGGIGEARIKLNTRIAREVTFEPAATDKGRYLLTDMPQGFDELVVEGHTRLIDNQPVQVLSDKPLEGTRSALVSP
jgi:RND family efflux transporter MFP subunit